MSVLNTFCFALVFSVWRRVGYQKQTNPFVQYSHQVFFYSVTTSLVRCQVGVRWQIICVLLCPWENPIHRAKSNLASPKSSGEGDQRLHVICPKALPSSTHSDRTRRRDRRRETFIHLNIHSSFNRHQSGLMVFSAVYSFSLSCCLFYSLKHSLMLLSLKLTQSDGLSNLFSCSDGNATGLFML